MSVRPAHFALSLLAVAAVIVTGCGVSAAAPPSAAPPTSAPATPTDPGADRGAGGGAVGDPGNPVGNEPPPMDPNFPTDGAVHVRPQAGVVNPSAHAWDHIGVAPDGRTITVYYYGGVEACYALAGVNVERDDDGLLIIEVLEGQRGDVPPDTACIELAVLKAVTVELEEPLIAPAR